MDTRVLILTLPSLGVLGLLIAHSIRTLPRARALIFWSSVLVYGVLRGVALRWVIAHGTGGAFPYAIRKPLFPVFGVPLQELAGWAIVAYLGWWLGCRFSRYLFSQIAWGCLFLGAISWAVESAAVAAGWWHWTVPVTQPLFVNVPFIAIVDWLFVGIDFLLPFVALTAPGLRKQPARFLVLLAFPVHFAAHGFAAATLAGIPIHHLAHWMLIAALVWLAMRSEVIDEPFAGGHVWFPIVGLGAILADAAGVELLVSDRPKLWVSLLPALAVSVQALRPMVGYVVGALALLLGAWLPAFAIAAAPAVTAIILSWGRRNRRWAPIVAVALMALLAVRAHSAGARDQEELKRRLSAAFAARDRGDLEAARRELVALAADHPGSHVPLALLGEIDYRTNRLEEARASFLREVEIKQNDARGYRYLAVIERRLGRQESAVRFAGNGLEVAPGDPELLYLSGRRAEAADAPAALSLTALAFEVGDEAGALLMLDRGISLWPDVREFYRLRVKLALRSGDAAAARRVLSVWRERFPQDAEARQLSRETGMN